VWCVPPAAAAEPGASTAAATSADVPSTPDTPKTKKDKQKDKDQSLDEVVVTGSLIPQSQAQSFTPVLTITNADIQSRGFADVAEALQHASISTGSIQDAQFEGFTQGAKVTSFFGLDPSYTKYLLNGSPMADYPALYNGSESFVSITGIPTVLVDRIDILPGAQSSIYGSDAIAAVVNVVMKTHMDGPVIDGRYGFYDDGGGASRRIAIGDGFTRGAFNVVAGAQYEDQNPIWAYQRTLTSQVYNQGSSPQIADRNYAVLGVYGQPNGDLYYFEDPANCANVLAEFNHTTALQTRPGYGQYCGTTRNADFTIGNADEQTQFYLHSTYDINEHLQVYGDTLLNHDVVRYNVGPNYYNSDEDTSSPYAYYEDPALGGGDYLNLQHEFSPEESGGLNNTTDKNTNNSVRGTLGIKGDFGSSWKWLADMTYSDNKLTESTHLFFTQQIEAFFAPIFGPQLGYDPNLGAYEYSPNYANFYKPVTPAQYDSFSGDAVNYSYTEESLARAQLTNSALFALPGGNAGMAVQFEGGDQGWNYSPDPRYFDNETFGYTSTAGSGHRSRYAGVAEMQLPIIDMLKANLSGRYDDYRVQGQSVDKATYNMGLEFRPVKMLLLRGRYGTAFKAPTLADEFQGYSGAYATLTDYYTCAKSGYTGGNVGNCPQANEGVFDSTSGNAKLNPITAKVWDLGFVLSPIDRLAFTLDYIHYAIRDEVAEADANKLLETESACRLGELDISSPTCVAALADVTRGPGGTLESVYTPKQNVSQENLGTFIAAVAYKYDAGMVGEFALDASFTDMVTHTYQQYAGDPLIDLLNDPFYSTEFKTKGNGSITWTKNPLSATVYVERYGRSPNYISQLIPEGYGQPGAGTISPWTLVNLSLRYTPIKSLELSANVDNVANRMPPADHSQPGNGDYQPYNQFDYNVYGREYYLTATYKLGQ
jgi:outer membrane receptor protein involved in Fe transport